MSLIPFKKIASAQPPATVFAAKYDFLLQWAKTFTAGNLDAAEDLVHETFLRFVRHTDEIEDPDNAEGLLYIYLKRVYSAQLRRMQRHRFQSIDSMTAVEFDSLQMSLREQCDADPVTVQCDLRRIIFYLCWRKEDVKSASVLLLRFFHGYFPEEIMKVSLLSRPSVDYALNAARDEVRLYLQEPGRLRIMHGEKMPEFVPVEVALPIYDLMDELRDTLFQSRHTPCLSKEHLLAYYRSKEKTPISRELLSHVVSCRECLDFVTSRQGLSPLSEVSSETILSQARRSGHGNGKKHVSISTGTKRMLEVGERRLREVLEHRPRTLTISVNGDVIASQNVESSRNTQRVEVKGGAPHDLIEVLSDQGVCMLPIFLRTLPPDAPPEIRHEIKLSDARSVEACLVFTVEGYAIEVSYFDPDFFGEISDQTRRICEEELATPIAQPSFVENTETRNTSSAVELTTRFAVWLRRWLISPIRPASAIACGLALASIVCLITWLGVRPIPITANTLLVRSQVWDTLAANGGQPGVVRQRLTIQMSGRRTDRTIYRDLEGRRRWREGAVGNEDKKVRERLAIAGIAWDAPFSATHYQEWHDHQHVRQDTIERPGRHLLRLTTSVPEGPVSRESITVRDTDFHPVQRSTDFRDGETVEIAEVDYEVLPWSRVEPNLFDLSNSPRPAVSDMPRRSSGLSRSLPVVLSDVECDSAELGALLVLNRLHADAKEQIDVMRGATGVRVKGVVETAERKQELEEQLNLVPHVTSAIHTYAEMAKLSATQQEILSVATVSDVEQSTPLQRYLSDKGWTRDDIGQLSQGLFENGVAIERDSRAITDLEDRFVSKNKLSTTAQITLDQLLADHHEMLLTEIRKQQSLIARTGLTMRSDLRSAPSASDAEGLSSQAARVRALCKELLSDSNAETRSAERIISELADSLIDIQARAKLESTAVRADSSVSPLTVSPHKN